MRVFLSLFCLSLATLSWTQSAQQKFLEAKQAYSSRNFAQAVADFTPLVADQTFGAYATFYLALSKHKLGDHKGALDAFGQLQIKHPAFKQMEEVNFWRAYLYFTVADYVNGVQLATSFPDVETRRTLYAEFLSNQPYATLRELHNRFPADAELVTALAYTGVRTDLSDQERTFISSLITTTDLPSIAGDNFPVIKKERYTVAALLPFMFDGVENADRVMRNTLVMDLYQGMCLAADWLAQEGKHVDLLPYDTRKDKEQTVQILNDNGIKNADLIVGPLFPEPIEVVNEFSKQHRINVINPVTSNGKFFESNNLAFIHKPSYKTMARKAAEYMAATARRSEVMIYFENKSPDRELAEEYTQAIQEMGLRVTKFEPVDVVESRKILARFTHQIEQTLGITDEEAALLKYKGRLIRTRSKYDAAGKLILRPDGTPDIEYYELIFTLNTDSLDHIFAATRSNVIANNFVGALEFNPDSVRLLGLSDWLDFTMLDYKQLERQRVSLIHPDFVDKNNPFYQEFQRRFEARFKRMPSTFHLLGFETVWWAGHMMHAHGKYFQNGFFNKNDFPSVFYGHEFLPGGNDNQRVPVVQFQDKQLKEVNISNESNDK